MKKKYLKTVEDVIALKDTDTKIYTEENEERYYQFIKGVLCCFGTNSDYVCIGDWVMLEMNLYTLEEEPMQEATEEDIGKLCLFWDGSEKHKVIGILDEYDKYGEDCKYFSSGIGNYHNGRRLTPSEVAEITGYKVEE